MMPCINIDECPHLMRAGKCFEEAKQFKTERKSELITLIESKRTLLTNDIECLLKFVQTRIFEYFKKGKGEAPDIESPVITDRESRLPQNKDISKGLK